MKKTLLLLTSAALLLVGCAKEKFAEPIDGGLTNVTFTASLDNGVATKAVDDGDGAAANVNRCIMEIYYGDELFARQIEKVTDKHATFTAQVVSNRTYKVAFWADCVDDATTPTGLAADKYYTTNAGLTAIALKGTYAGNDDARDAFFHVGNYTVAQAGSSFGSGDDKILLKRPFAQMNVITTDWDKVKTIEALKPGKVSVTLKNPMVKFNAVTGVASADANTPSLEYTADVYVAPAPTGTAPATDKTLSMDYLFASDTKALIDIDWKALHGTDTPVAHAFAAVPYQRNYRTNIKGALLTTQGQWTVEVYPIWGDPDHEKLVVATTVLDIEGMNNFVAANPNADQIDVTFSAEPNDAGVPTQGGDANAIVTSTLKANSDLNVTVASNTKTLYVGDFISEKNITVVETSSAATVNITVPQGKKIETLVINAPFKSVYLNGQQITGVVGRLENVEATTSEHTLVVEAGQSIGTLTVHQGGLEIHGTVETLEIEETARNTNPVKVRTSENLSQEVFDVIYKEGEGGHDYIDRPNFSEKRNANGTWDIVPSVCKIGETYYGSLAAAVAAVPANAQTTITMVADHEILGNAGVTIPVTKNIVLDLAGFTVKNLVNESKASQIIANYGTLKITGNGTLINSAAEGTQTGEWWSDPQRNYATNVISNYGNLTIDGANLSETATSSICYAIDNNSSGSDVTCTIKSGHIYTLASTAIRMFCNSTTKENVINVEGGLIEGGYAGIWLQLPGSSSQKKKGTLNISGGTLKGTYAWYDYTYGDLFDEVKVNISGGLLEGNVFSFGANIKIEGGEFLKEVEIKQTKSSNVSVSGGKFATDLYTEGDNASTHYITGGVFAEKDGCKWTDGIADGYAVVANTDPATKSEYPWAVKAQGQAKIGDVVYPTLEEAVAAAVEAGSGTIELLPAYIESGRYPQAWITSPCNINDVPQELVQTYTFHAFNPNKPSANVLSDEEIYEKCSVNINFDNPESSTINMDELNDNEKERVAAILAECNDYLNWPCDYEVYFDNADNAQVSIQGNYAVFGWISCDIDQALLGDRQRLLKTMLSEEWAAKFNYMAMLGFVNQFHCGLSNDEPANNAGKTFSVELYMYHPEKENVKILISRTDYTFPQVN